MLIPVPLTDQQSKAVEATAKLGQTVIAESGELARYVGRVLGTLPKDVVGLFLGDPFHAVRTVIAAKLDGLVSELLVRRDVRNTEGVSPSIAIPLLKRLMMKADLSCKNFGRGLSLLLWIQLDLIGSDCRSLML